MAQRDAQTFLAGIKKKYPQYANIDDATLLSTIQKKYPQYKDIALDTRPNFNNLLGSLRKAQFGPFPFIPSSAEETKDIGRAGLKGFSSLLGGLPEFASGDTLPEPETPFGRSLSSAFQTAPYFVGGVGAFKGLGALGKALESRRLTKTIGQVKDIQKSFFPFVKEESRKFGKSLRGGFKELIQKGKFKVPKEDAEAILGKIKFSQIKDQLPKKALDEVSRLYDKIDDLTPQDLRLLRARLRNTLSKPELSGKTFTERSRLIKEVDRDLGNYIKSKVPGMEEANKQYGAFAKVRETVEKRFRPGQGTQVGERTLRKVKELPSEDISNLRTFEKATGHKFLDRAFRQEALRNIKKGVSVALPWAGLTSGLGIGGYLGLKTALSGLND